MVVAYQLSGNDLSDIINEYGSLAGFIALRDAYENEIKRWIRRVLGVKHCPDPMADGDDVFQLTWDAVFQSLKEGTMVREPKSWLFKIAVNFCINDIRRHVADRTISVDVIAEENLPQRHVETVPAPFTTLIEYRLYLGEIRELMLKEFYSSTWERRMAFDLFLNGFYHNEIDRILRLASGTSRQWILRAAKRVRSVINQHNNSGLGE